MQDYEQLAQRIRAEVREAAARTPEWVKKHVEKVWHECYGQKDKAKTDEVEQRLREIEERASRATPGPWYAHNPDDDMSMNVFLVATTPEEPDPWWDGEEEAKKVVAITLLQSPRVADVADGRWEENAGFIAHAREDVPWLLSLLREREEENRRLREALAAIRDYAAPRSDLSVYVEIMYEMASDAIRGEQP